MPSGYFDGSMKPTVFIQANRRQYLGAVIGEHALRRNSQHSDSFDVRIMLQEEIPVFREHEGKRYLFDGNLRTWRNNDLQSFTPLRFLPPELMGYQGRAVVIDPDIFAVADVWDLLNKEMDGKALLCRTRFWEDGTVRYRASSVMLLDCAKLTHWRMEDIFRDMFTCRWDYLDWVNLNREPEENIGTLEDQWNDFDTLTPETKMLHNTKRRTQPWKTGLPVDFNQSDKVLLGINFAWLRNLRNLLRGLPARGRYKPHPDKNQENLVFGLLRECLDSGKVSESELRKEMSANHLRHDALELIRRAPALP